MQQRFARCWSTRFDRRGRSSSSGDDNAWLLWGAPWLLAGWRNGHGQGKKGSRDPVLSATGLNGLNLVYLTLGRRYRTLVVARESEVVGGESRTLDGAKRTE